MLFLHFLERMGCTFSTAAAKILFCQKKAIEVQSACGGGQIGKGSNCLTYILENIPFRAEGALFHLYGSHTQGQRISGL